MIKRPHPGYEMVLRNYRLDSSRGGAYICIVMVLAGAVLDYGLYPQHQLDFALARILCSLVIFGAILLLRTNWGRIYTPALTFFWLMMPQVMIAWMISVTEGANSIYYAGLNLAIYASGIALPFSVLQNLLLSALTLVLYVFACANYPESFVLHGPFLVNSLLLAFGGVTASACTMYNEKARFMLFQLRAELAERNRQLERTNRDLSQIKGQMLQQEKMAAIGTLAAGLLHEVNNPVSYCLMAIDLAMEEPISHESPTLRECLEDAKQGMRRVQHIVSDLKTFAYRNPDTQMIGNQFPFKKVLETAIRFTGHELKGVKVTSDLPEEDMVRGDDGALVGVLINLLSNAVLAMRKANQPEMKIHVSASWVDNRLRVEVLDNGPGISATNLQRVFEPFFTTREVGQGLGLGLSISYRVIEQHGGTLMAESVVGEWTKMIFDLPRAERGGA
ncbi:MAG: HAMP domain-containing histidine kinase [Burkholderiales bacterium]|nr:HAMP domain-containing histidine kinase [Burkholderiales bacterium]